MPQWPSHGILLPVVPAGVQSPHALVRDLFLRGLALVHLVALLSLWVQLDGLVGSNGIVPVTDVLGARWEERGSWMMWHAPSLWWAWPTDGMLHLLCGVGVLASVLLLIGVLPWANTLVLYVAYLSLYSVTWDWLAYQWDALLLEVTFAALWVAPFSLWLHRGAPPPPLGMLLLRVVAVKLMFLSGYVKLTSGDPTWWDLSALTYHYWTQPLPNPVAYYVWKLPNAFHALSTLLTFIVELVVPWLVFGPRLTREIAFVLFTGLMGMLFVTGNYGFFQVLSVVLFLAILDDQSLTRWLRPLPFPKRALSKPAIGYALLPVGMALLVLNVYTTVETVAVRAGAERPEGLYRFDYWFSRWGIENSYGLFAKMTTSRPELVLEGSRDGVAWTPYELRYKVGDPYGMPPVIPLHMPRLDWKMWFAALRAEEYPDVDCNVRDPFLPILMGELAMGNPTVTALLGPDPFEGNPPRYVRASLYQYVFTSSIEPGDPGAWWARVRIRTDCPVVEGPG